MEVLKTIISISIMSSLLALLVVIADKLLNSYGECRIDINKGSRILKVQGGTTLLSALSSQKIFIPSACGGKATCGLCKVQIIDGGGVLLPTEEPYLTAEEENNGMRLSCQVKVKRDIKISIPQELFSIRQFKTKVARITQMTHDIKEFELMLPDSETITFKAGQYIQVLSKPYDKIKESVSRAYSIASVPSLEDRLEIIVRQVPGGICTTYMHQYLKVGDELVLNGPYGDFYLRETGKELVMIAGGSGLAPIKSIILDVIERNLDRQMTFFFGAVTGKDLYYVDYFRDLERKYGNFRFVPALSKPAPEDAWDGELGLITDVVERHVKDANDKGAYLCGSPGMINACINVLKKIGFTGDMIYYDKF